MEIIQLKHPLKNCIQESRPCVLAPGFFDGLHLGHQQVIQTAKCISDRMGIELVVMTFTPHPKQVVGYANAPVNYLTPMHVKEKLLRSLGVQKLYVIHFDRHIAQLSSDDFVQQCLMKCRVKHVVAGFDFRYGYKGEGNMKTLEKQGSGNFNVTSVKEVKRWGQKVSSTMIREFLSNGEVHRIKDFLGTSYETLGKVNSPILFEANSYHSTFKVRVQQEYLLPKPGVYFVEFTINHRIYRGMVDLVDNSNDLRSFIFVRRQSSRINGIDADPDINIKWLRKTKREELMDLLLSRGIFSRNDEIIESII